VKRWSAHQFLFHIMNFANVYYYCNKQALSSRAITLDSTIWPIRVLLGKESQLFQTLWEKRRCCDVYYENIKVFLTLDACKPIVEGLQNKSRPFKKNW